MPITKKNYEINVGTSKVLLRLPDTYDSIKTIVGLTDAPANSTALNAKKVSFLFENGLAARIRVTRKVGVKYVRTNIICDLEKLATAFVALEGKQFGTGSTAGAGEIISAGFPTRRRLG